MLIVNKIEIKRTEQKNIHDYKTFFLESPLYQNACVIKF
jgi:hypothetical protein